MSRKANSTTASPASGVRCAIYTRKSTEEGLEQEFNSLDAQRESAEAYIKSQQHEGWTCLPDRYDDGGFTGGNMDPLKGRMDFEFETMRAELVKEIEEAINIEAQKGHEVKVNILPREEAFQIPDLIRTKINLLPEGIKEIRTIEIVGLDLQADGGTHVKNTSEVGELRVTNYKSKGKINKRIYVEVV